MRIWDWLFHRKETKAMNAELNRRLTKPEVIAQIKESVRKNKEGNALILDAMKRAAEGREKVRLDMRRANG